jgi:hypothetical protein
MPTETSAVPERAVVRRRPPGDSPIWAALAPTLGPLVLLGLGLGLLAPTLGLLGLLALGLGLLVSGLLALGLLAVGALRNPGDASVLAALAPVRRLVG